MTGNSNTGHLVKIMAITAVVCLLIKLFAFGTLGTLILIGCALVVYGKA